MDKPSMFEQARSLVAGAKIIIDSDGINDNGEIKKPTTPVILACAFAIEVLLKLLILQETGNSASGHNLEALYNQLPEGLKDQVISRYISQNQEETIDSLNEKMNAHKRVFVDWRYAFEGQNDQECSPSFLYSFAYSLSTFVEDNYDFERNDNGWLKITSS